MKFIAVVMSLCVSLASAGVVIIPIKPEQVVPKASEDCYFGVVTPMGCGYVVPFLSIMGVFFGSFADFVCVCVDLSGTTR